jgi:hypothetical protein
MVRSRTMPHDQTSRSKVKLPPAKPVAYWVSASTAPLNHAPPKAAELYCVRSCSLIKNLLQAMNPFFSSPFNTEGHKGEGWEGDGLLVGSEKAPSPPSPSPWRGGNSSPASSSTLPPYRSNVFASSGRAGGLPLRGDAGRTQSSRPAQS